MRWLMFGTSIATVWIALLVFGVASYLPPTDNGIPHSLVDTSVMVRTAKGTGSGVVFKNGAETFVWTDAHVVENCQSTRLVIDPNTNQQKHLIEYTDVMLVSFKQQNGRKVGEDVRFGKIIRFNKEEDIALISVYQKGWLKNSVKFAPKEYIPKQGMLVWHVGCPMGNLGACSVMSGSFNFAGRLRKNCEHADLNGYIYDQVALPATFGSSGGGVFLQSNNQCIGLITEFLYDPRVSQGLCCITPARRLWEFAKRNDCEWAMTPSIASPADLTVSTEDYITVSKNNNKMPEVE